MFVLRWTLPLATLAGFSAVLGIPESPQPLAGDERSETEPHRSPIALAISADGSRLLTANQTADSVSLIDTESLEVLDEIETGRKPAGVAISADGTRGVVTHWFGYDLAILRIEGDELAIADRVEVGPEPRGVAMRPDGSAAFVTVGVTNEVVEVDLDKAEVVRRATVGREPQSLALSPDGQTLVVGNARGSSVTLLKAEDLSPIRTVDIDGANLRQIATDPDGEHAYVVNIRNRRMATTERNIDLGWVLGQRLTRVPLGSEPEEDFATISLDPQGEAVGDVHGVAVSSDGRFIAIGAGGTHEVLILRTDIEPLPWRIEGSRDLIHYELLQGDGRFRRVETGGRPTEVVFHPDAKRLFVANYFEDSVQVIDAETAELIGSIHLGGPEEPSLARRGERLFHDATRSHNQWYSCHTCHSDGHTNGETFDTRNDGWQDLRSIPKLSRKVVPTLRGVTETEPWTWHGWQTSLEDAMVESFTQTMQGPRPTEEEIEAIIAFLGTLEHPPNPYREPDGSLSEAAQRGREVFRSPKAACNTCHSGPEFTDGEIHIVGLETDRDRYEGYNPPSLKGVYDHDPYLHDGRAETLREVLTGDHAPDFVTGLGSLSEQELNDLIAYLKTL